MTTRERTSPPPALVGPAGGGSTPRPPARRIRFRFSTRARWGLGSVVVVVAAWQLAGSTGLIDASFAATPAEVAVAGVDLVTSGELWSNAQVTIVEFAVGLLGAVVVGIPVGMLMGWRTRVRQTLEPSLVALYVTPSLALLPLVVLALGIGPASKIAMVFVEAVITIAVNAMAAIRETDPMLVRAARSFGAGERALFTSVLFPGSLPTIMAGLRLGTGRGVIAVIVAELYGGTDGIGQLIASYGQSFEVAPLLFLTLVVAAFGYAVTAALRALGDAATPWRVSA